MRAPRSTIALLLLFSACSTQPIPITHPPDLAVAPDLTPAPGGADLSDVPDLTLVPDLTKPAPDLVRPADLSPPPDLTPPPDLEPAPDLTPPPDLAPPADLVACGMPGQPCCDAKMCQGNGFSCWQDNVCRMCGKFGQEPCANYTCDMGLSALVEGDFCANQKPRVCTTAFNCGGLGLPPCADNGQPDFLGHCLVGRRVFQGKCAACI